MQQTPCIAGREAGQRELVCRRHWNVGAHSSNIQIDHMNIGLMPSRTTEHMRTLRVNQQIIQRLFQQGPPNPQKTGPSQPFVVAIVMHQPIKNVFGLRVVGNLPQFTASAKCDDKALSPGVRPKHQGRVQHSPRCQWAGRWQNVAANCAAFAVLQQQPLRRRVGCQSPQTVA